MAELLVKAQEAWNHEADTKKMTDDEIKAWNARSRKGDVIVVRPDGWAWGREECPPRFVVIKIPGVKVEDVKHYEEQLIEVDDVNYKAEMFKTRKHAVDVATVEDCLKQADGVKEISAEAVTSKLLVKTVVDAKAELAAVIAAKEVG